MPLDNDTPKVRNQPYTRPEVAAQKDVVAKAHDEATKDMEEDADLNTRPDPDADLDEGELARLKGKDGTYPQE